MGMSFEKRSQSSIKLLFSKNVKLTQCRLRNGRAPGSQKRGRGDVKHDSGGGSGGAIDSVGDDGHGDGDDRAVAANATQEAAARKGRKTHSRRNAEQRAAGHPV